MEFSWFRLGGKIGRNEYPPLVRPFSKELNIRLFSGSRLHLHVIISARIRARAETMALRDPYLDVVRY